MPEYRSARPRPLQLQAGDVFGERVLGGVGFGLGAGGVAVEAFERILLLVQLPSGAIGRCEEPNRSFRISCMVIQV